MFVQKWNNRQLNIYRLVVKQYHDIRKCDFDCIGKKIQRTANCTLNGAFYFADQPRNNTPQYKHTLTCKVVEEHLTVCFHFHFGFLSCYKVILI